MLGVACFALPIFAQYGGPAILSRGEAPAAMASPTVNFRPFIEVSAQYDTALAGLTVTDTGQLASQSGYGGDIGWGISGLHSWRHTKVGVDYRGDYSRYNTTGFSSLDQSLLLGITQQLSRRATLSLREGAGLFTRNFGLFGLPDTVPFDPNRMFIPTTDYFDNRTYYLSSLADLALRKSARLSFDLGGGYFYTGRQSAALHGSVGVMAQGDAQYRITRRTTIGAGYQYMHFGFTHLLGGSDVHGVTGSYAVSLSKTLEFSGYAGVMRIESKFAESAPVDPVIAELLGIQSTSQIVHLIEWAPNASGRLARTFRTGVAYVAAGHTVSPGNGLFATSLGTSVVAGYSYTGLRRWSFGLEGEYTTFRTLEVISAAYSSDGVYCNMSRQLGHSISFTSSFGMRRYASSDFANYNRVGEDARVGFGFSPGDVPIRIW